MLQEEYFFDCPHCGESVSILIDLSVESQNLIEDCEVCCHPMSINYTVVDGEIEEFNASKA